MPSKPNDRLEEALDILRKKGAILAASAYCHSLFGHSKIDKLDSNEREKLTVLLRQRIIEASIATGESWGDDDQPPTLQ